MDLSEMNMMGSSTADLSSLKYGEDDRNILRWDLEREWKEWGLVDSLSSYESGI